MGPRKKLNKLKWHPDFEIKNAEITIVHRGAPRDRKTLSGANVLDIGSGFLMIESEDKEVRIPYHRIVEIKILGETIWKRDH